MINDSESKVLKVLLDGNKRFYSGKMNHQNQSPERIKETSKGQNPIAAIIGCSDSRIVPEILFDQGIGDLFTIRVAGNTVGNVCIGSVEYAAEHLEVPIVLVLGHTHCGVFKAATQGDDVHHHLGSLVNTAKKAVSLAKDKKGCLLDNAIRENIHILADKLEHSSPTIKRLVSEKKLSIIGAIYDIETGKVELLN